MQNNLFDVAVVGFGPVGQLLSMLLARKGHSVLVIERWPEVYPQPRAVCYDHEIRRVLESQGLREGIDPLSRQGCLYQWFNADWELLTQFDWTAKSISGGPFGYFFNQPELEQVLSERAAQYPNVTLRRGWELTELQAGEQQCELHLRTTAGIQPDQPQQHEHLSARYVIGADGANSFVRKAMGVQWSDLGFSEDWLVVDVRPKNGFIVDVPDFAQWCNPRRPTTMVPGGPINRRWEFMRLPGESLEQLQSDEQVWSLLSRWIKPEQGELLRKTVYNFRSLIASEWRKGRVMLAGDAAHLMPPFMGQGMCTGMRDAFNLAWKLDLILQGRTGEQILDDYMPERRAQVEATIGASVTMGKVVCVSDPVLAAERDRAFFANEVAQPEPFPPIPEGLILRNRDGSQGKLAGTLGIHGEIRYQQQLHNVDQLSVGGFQLLTFAARGALALSAAERAIIDALDIEIIHLSRAGVEDANAWVDESGRYAEYFDQHRITALLVRPDFYVFGAADSQCSISTLLACLGQGLGLEVVEERMALAAH